MKRKSVVTILAVLFTCAALLSGCGKNSDEPVLSKESPLYNKALVDIESVSKDIYIPLGESLSVYIDGGVEVNTQNTDILVSDVSYYDFFKRAVMDKGATVPEDGHYYRIFNNYIGVYLSSRECETNDGMRTYYDPGDDSTVWKVSKKGDGYLLESPAGYLSFETSLKCDSEGSVISLVPSTAEFSEDSYGLVAECDGQKYRIDLPSVDKAISYPDDGGTYPHTSFRFLELDSAGVSCTRLMMSGKSLGDTSFKLNEEEYSVHVYDRTIQNIDFENSGEAVETSGYNLPDDDLHDEGFFTYQCDPASGKISFYSIGEGKSKIRIGDLDYYVRFGQKEATYLGKKYPSLYSAVKEAQENSDSRLPENRVISLKSSDTLFEGLIPSGLLIKPGEQYGMGEDIMLSYSVSADKKEESFRYDIYPIKVGDKAYLFLPSCADYTAINLHLPKGTIITSDDNQNGITVEDNNDNIDLSAIFDDISEPGRKYPISICWVTDSLRLEQEIILTKAENTESLYFEIEEEGVEDVTGWLRLNRENEAKDGYAIMLSPSGKTIYSGKLNTIHVRGNTNKGMPELKQSLSFKLSKKAKLLEGVKAKSWCLIANYAAGRDTTTYATAIGDTLYSYMNAEAGGDYAVRFSPVDVYINGEYCGIYILSDKVNDDRVEIKKSTYLAEGEEVKKAENDESDIALAKGIQEYWYAPDSVLGILCEDGTDTEEGGNGGFIIEICGYTQPNSYGFISAKGVPIEIKEPKCPTKEQVQQIAAYYQDFEDALYSENGKDTAGRALSELIDYRSFSKMYVLKSFLRDMDFFWSSVYMYIDADDSGFTTPLKCCAAWDFDACFATISAGDTSLFEGSLYADYSAIDYKWQLLEHPDFVAVLREMSVDNVYLDGTESFTDLIADICEKDGFIDTYYSTVNASMCMNKVIWPDCSWANTGETTAVIMKQRMETRVADWNNIWSDPETIGNIPTKTFSP